MNRSAYAWLLLVPVLLSAASPVLAQRPQTMSYQGLLTDGLGIPAASGAYNLTFSIYAVSTNGTPVWSESQVGVEVSNGEFSVILGSVTPINLSFDVQYWLGITVGADPELAPRVQLAYSPALNGPGIAQGKVSGPISITNTGAMSDVITTTITIPAAGYILVDARATAVFSGVTTTNAIDYQIDESAGGVGDVNQVFAAGGDGYPNTAFYNQAVSFKRVYSKAAGSYTFRLEAQKIGTGTCQIVRPSITAIYIPTAYGTVTLP